MSSNHTDYGMYDLLSLINEINSISINFDEINETFRPLSLPLPKVTPAELGFIRVISWLYVQYYEAGKLGTEFLGKLISAYALDANNADIHRDRIQKLRTYLQHNLSPNETRSKEISNACETWFKEKCGTPVPADEAHWSQLLTEIIHEAKNYLGTLRSVLRKIEQDDNKLQIINDWQVRIKRFHPPHEFDRIIDIVAKDLGQDAIDIVKFRSRYYDRWKRKFELHTDFYDFEVEARKLIEMALISEEPKTLPITGTDIMDTFDIKPGREIGEALKIANEIFTSSPCNKEELIKALKYKLLK